MAPDSGSNGTDKKLTIEFFSDIDASVLLKIVSENLDSQIILHGGPRCYIRLDNEDVFIAYDGSKIRSSFVEPKMRVVQVKMQDFMSSYYNLVGKHPGLNANQLIGQFVKVNANGVFNSFLFGIALQKIGWQQRVE